MESPVMREEFAQRRARLMEIVGSGAVIFASAPYALHHNDVEHNYRQDSEFYYFTGFPEPEAVALVVPTHEEHRFVLFVRPKDKEKETWTGYRGGVEDARAIYGADAAYPIGELDEHLPKYLEKADAIYYTFGHNEAINQKVLYHYRRLVASYPRRGHGPEAIKERSFVTAPLRQIKSDYEIAQMEKAIEISSRAHNHVQSIVCPGMYEYELQAILEGDFRKCGAMGFAYPSIVASGANSCVLHYVDNNCQIGAGDLVLIDAGCCFNYYNADITRTFPADGKFSPEQQTIYDIVLAAQIKAIGAVRPNNTIHDVHQAALTTIVEGLLEIGLLEGNFDEIIEKEAYKPFFMHRTSHWLGIDVHDTGLYKTNGEWASLSPQMVITVEPGIYISPTIEPAEGQPPIPDRWQGIGVRIEDDVLVTTTGSRVLTAGVAK